MDVWCQSDDCPEDKGSYFDMTWHAPKLHNLKSPRILGQNDYWRPLTHNTWGEYYYYIVRPQLTICIIYVAGLSLLLIKINRALTPYNFLLFATFHDLEVTLAVLALA